MLFTPTPTQVNPFFKILLFLSPAFGTILGNDFDESPRIALYARSSTDDGDHGASRSHQLQTLRTRIDSFDGTIIDINKVVESAKTTDRDSLKKYIELAKNGEIDAIGVMSVDRLTRAPVFEAADFYQKMQRADCLLYCSSIGFVDWDDLNDIQQLLNQTVFARKWFSRIKEGAAGSIISDLKDGKYPKGRPPVGFETDDDNNIWVKKGEREFVYRTFKKYTRIRNRSKLRSEMNERRRKQEKEELSDTRYRTLLQSPLCIGHLEYDGQLISVKPELQVIDEETYYKVQNILRERKPSKEGEQDVPDFVGRAIDRYGFDHIISILESFERRCRECGGNLKPNGGTTINSIPLQSYQCQDCNHQGPLLQEDEIKEIHQTLPLRCPVCPNTELFEVEELEGFEEYRYTCQACDDSFKHSSPPDKIERALRYPAEKFDIEKKYSERGNEPTSSSSDGPGSPDLIAEKQTSLSSF